MRERPRLPLLLSALLSMASVGNARLSTRQQIDSGQKEEKYL
jgi:hypothetical protein